MSSRAATAGRTEMTEVRACRAGRAHTPFMQVKWGTAAASAAVVLLLAGCGGGVNKSSAAYTAGHDAGFQEAQTFSGTYDKGSSDAELKSTCTDEVFVLWAGGQPGTADLIVHGGSKKRDFVAGCVAGMRSGVG